MTTRSRMPSIVAGLFLTLALAAAAGCAAKSPNVPAAPPPGDPGDGQFGEVEATPSLIPTPTEPPAPDPSPTTLGPGVILTINPNFQFLLWPSPPDCVTYDPASAGIVTLLAIAPATPIYQVKAGSTVILSFKRLVDA
ncbi:MAG: hypothetical protein L0Y54_24380, partial [Sporichthyaceae bacterium]|nr:hypothetical protein [Sporichthyaceae bacterium]